MITGCVVVGGRICGLVHVYRRACTSTEWYDGWNLAPPSAEPSGVDGSVDFKVLISIRVHQVCVLVLQAFSFSPSFACIVFRDEAHAEGPPCFKLLKMMSLCTVL